MGTKTKPGKFDCYAQARVDEPMFVLLGRDPTAGLLVKLWTEIRAEMGRTEDAQIDEARLASFSLDAYASGLGKSPSEARAAFARVLKRLEAQGALATLGQ